MTEVQGRLFVAEVSELMWSLVERESVGMPLRPRPEIDVLDVFSRLMAARDRFVKSLPTPETVVEPLTAERQRIRESVERLPKLGRSFSGGDIIARAEGLAIIDGETDG